MSIISNPTIVVTGEVRLSYVNVFEPKAFQDAEPKYSLTILIPKDTEDGKKTIANIKAAIQAAAEKGAQKHFGGRVPAAVKHT